MTYPRSEVVMEDLVLLESFRSAKYRLGIRQIASMTVICVVVISSLVVGTLAGTSYDSNNYLDNILSTSLPQQARMFNMNGIPLNGFRFKLKKTSRLSRDVKAEFTNGVLSGLGAPGALRRQGDCTAPMWQRNNVTIGCYVSLEGLAATFRGVVKGESLLSIGNDIDMRATFRQSKAFLEVTSAPGATPHLIAWSVMPLDIQVEYSRPLNLKSRRSKFQQQVKKNVEKEVKAALYGPVDFVLSNAVKAQKLPLP